MTHKRLPKSQLVVLKIHFYILATLRFFFEILDFNSEDGEPHSQRIEKRKKFLKNFVLVRNKPVLSLRRDIAAAELYFLSTF